MKNSSFWKMLMLTYLSEKMDSPHEHKFYKAPLTRLFWKGGNYVHVFILPTDAWQKMKSQDWILQMLWKYAKFQISGSNVRNKNYSHEKPRTDKIKEKPATIQFGIIMSTHILSWNKMLKCTVLKLYLLFYKGVNVSLSLCRKSKQSKCLWTKWWEYLEKEKEVTEEFVSYVQRHFIFCTHYLILLGTLMSFVNMAMNSWVPYKQEYLARVRNH